MPLEPLSRSAVLALKLLEQDFHAFASGRCQAEKGSPGVRGVALPFNISILDQNCNPSQSGRCWNACGNTCACYRYLLPGFFGSIEIKKNIPRRIAEKISFEHGVAFPSRVVNFSGDVSVIWLRLKRMFCGYPSVGFEPRLKFLEIRRPIPVSANIFVHSRAPADCPAYIVS